MATTRQRAESSAKKEKDDVLVRTPRQRAESLISARKEKDDVLESPREKAEPLTSPRQANPLQKLIEKTIKESLPILRSQLSTFDRILKKNHVNFSEAKKLIAVFESYICAYEFCFHLVEFATRFNVSISSANIFSFQALRIETAKTEKEIKMIKDYLLTIEESSYQLHLSPAVARRLNERVENLKTSSYTKLFDVASGLTKGFEDKIEALGKKRDSLFVIRHNCVRELIVSEILKCVVIVLMGKIQLDPQFQKDLSKYRVAKETVNAFTSLHQFTTFSREFFEWRQSQAKETLDQMEAAFYLLEDIAEHNQFIAYNRYAQDDAEYLSCLRSISEISPRSLQCNEMLQSIHAALNAFKFIRENEEVFNSKLKLTPIVTLPSAVSARARGPRRQRSLSVTHNPLNDSSSESDPDLQAKRPFSKEYGDTKKYRLFQPERTPEVKAKAAALAEEAKTVTLRKVSGSGTPSS